MIEHRNQIIFREIPISYILTFIVFNYIFTRASWGKTDYAGSKKNTIKIFQQSF